MQAISGASSSPFSLSGFEYRISKKPADLASADRLIFPGVGEARFAMKELKSSGFDPFLREWAASGKPLLGVCLGSQIIFEHSEEGDTPCLGLIAGNSPTFPAELQKPRDFKVPHMGWNDIGYHNGGSSLFDGVKEHSDFYFVHSYYIDPSDPSVISASVDYGMNVPCAVKKGNIEAVSVSSREIGRKRPQDIDQLLPRKRQGIGRRIMLKKRIIVCLDVKDGRTTKGVKFLDNVDIGDPVIMADEYYRQGVDELVFYDIMASARDRGPHARSHRPRGGILYTFRFCVGGGQSPRWKTSATRFWQAPKR